MLRVTDRGVKSWWYRWQRDGQTHERKIGEHPSMTLVEARARVEELRGQPSDQPTMRDLWRRYEAEHLPKRRESTAAKDTERWRVHVEPAIGARTVEGITRDDVAKLHAAISRKRPGAANRVLSLLSKMFALAERWGMRREANPARGHDRNAERKIERYLTADEYARLVAALEAEDPIVRDAIAMAMHTGARIGEVLDRRRADVDRARQRLRMGQTKTGPDWLTCPPAAWAIVERRTTDPLFPIDYAKLWRRWMVIRKRAKLPDLRIHDLRHGFASVGIAEGLSLPQIGALLRHKSPATTARYAHLADAAKREHAALISSRIPSIDASAKRSTRPGQRADR